MARFQVLAAAVLLMPFVHAVRQTANVKGELADNSEEEGKGVQTANVQAEVASNKEERTGVQITQGWADAQTLDLTNAFLTVWNAIPLTSSSDFTISGDLVHMVKVLQERPHLPVECESMWIGQPVSLVVTHPGDKAADLFLKAFVGGYAQIGGVATLAVKIADMIKTTAVTSIVSSLAANPSRVNLDNAIDAILRSDKINDISSNKRWTPKSIWYWLTGKKTIATLTLKTKYDRKYNPPMVKFQCVKNEHPGEFGTRDRPAYVAMLGEDGEMIPLNAHRLQLFLMALS